MRHRILLLALVLLSIVCNIPADEPTNTGNLQKISGSERIRKLIDNLGDADFTKRDQASRELEALGGEAKEALLAAAQSQDVEIASRAAGLLDSMHEKAVTAAFLAPKRVRFVLKDAPLEEAVGLLSKMSGYNIAMITTAKDRKVTLNTGDATFFEALNTLCQKANLVEQPAPKPAPRNPYNSSYVQPMPPTGNVMQTITLVDGAASNQPLFSSGSVRIRVASVDKNNLPADEGRITLDVSAEPRLKNFGVVGSIVLEKALDDQGQQLALALHLPDPNLANLNVNVNGFRGNRVIMVNGAWIPAHLANQVPQGPPTLNLKLGVKGAKTLKQLSGRISVEALGEPEAQVVVKDVLNAATRRTKGKDGSVISVHTVDKQADGSLRIQITMENFEGSTVPAFMGNMKLRNRGKMMINGAWIGAPTEMPKLVDAKGQVYSATVSDDSCDIGNGQVVCHATLTYPATQADASQLVLYAQRPVIFTLPFTLENVPLP